MQPTISLLSGLCCNVPTPPAPRSNVVPIAALFSGTLWLGNAAYLYLSVSFIQMVKVRFAKKTAGG